MPVYVDIPDPIMLNNPNGSWKSVGVFTDKQKAVEWIREHIDPTCDDEGRICLISMDEITEESGPSLLQAHQL